MAEFFKKGQREQKAEQEWIDRFRGSFERALGNIDRHQERKLLTSQTIFVAFLGGFFLDLLASSVYNLLSSVGSSSTSSILTLPIAIALISTGALVAAFGILWRQLSQYRPALPMLGLAITPEDTKPFLHESQFQSIKDFLGKGEFKDFRAFGNNFFESLERWFSYMFTEKVSKEPRKRSEELEEPFRKQFPTMIREYDISAMSPSGVKINLEVILSPHVIYGFSQKGDETATYTFYAIFRFKILNPQHEDARDFLDYYYHLYAGHILRFSSHSIVSAFKKLGLFQKS